MHGVSSRAALAVRLGADHERVPGPGTEEVGFAKGGVAEVRIETYRRMVFFPVIARSNSSEKRIKLFLMCHPYPSCLLCEHPPEHEGGERSSHLAGKESHPGVL